jgi:hypothetical protein
VPVLEVEVVCTDETEHRRRVESRVADIDGHRLPTWQEVVERDYRAWDRPRLVVDTARQTVPQIVQAILSTSPPRQSPSVPGDRRPVVTPPG